MYCIIKLLKNLNQNYVVGSFNRSLGKKRHLVKALNEKQFVSAIQSIY